MARWPRGWPRSHPGHPPVRLLGLAALDGYQPLAQLARVGPDVPAAYPMLLAVVNESTHARENGRRAGERGLTGADPLEHLGDVEDPLLDAVALLSRQGEDRIAGHPMEEGRVEAAGEHRAIADQQEVGGSCFLHGPAGAEQHLVGLVSAPRLQSGAERSGVVAARLHLARLRGRARIDILDVDAQRLHAAGEVIPYRAGEHDETGLG